jgi:hypothetical protein
MKTRIRIIKAAAAEEGDLLGVGGESAGSSTSLTNLVGTYNNKVAALTAKEFHASPSAKVVGERSFYATHKGSGNTEESATWFVERGPCGLAATGGEFAVVPYFRFGLMK